MLRWLAVLAVVINIIYFAVSYSSASKDVVAQNTLSLQSASSSLIMLSERKSTDIGDEKKSENNIVDGDKENKAEVVATEVQALQQFQNQKIESSVESAETAAQSTFPIEENKSDLQDSAETPSSQKETCWDIGKFATEATAKLLSERLSSLGETLVIQKRSMPGEPDYWVFLGPYDNRRQALAAHRDMQARKIDSFLIAEGELENAVSLGLFSLETGAQKMLQQRKKQGLDAKMRAVPRMRNEWWAMLNYAKGSLPDSVREIILSVQDDPALEIKTLACESIANTKKLD